MENDLKPARKVPFTQIFLDPNNPRIARDERPGYDKPSIIFDPTMQAALEKRVEEVYDVKNLEVAIVAQGWVPIDSILVWEHPKKKDHFIVVEGNTRTTVLRNIRARVKRERAKLERMEEKKGYAKQDVEEQQRFVQQLEKIIADTEQLEVCPINAKTVAELEAKLPHLLGVRHITPAKEWTPYARNLYILYLYDRLFRARHGDNEVLKLEPDLIEEVGRLLSLGATKSRRNIQAASAFSHFKREYEDELPEGEKFKDEDHYFFELILQNKYPQDQFGFGTQDLRLSPEMERVLFQWAFSKPRPEGEENFNILRIAEDIRLWKQMKQYDDSHGTSFASQLNVEDPDSAPSMAKLEAEYFAHKAQVSPIETIEALIENLKNLKVESLRSQASHLKPMIEEMVKTGQSYIKMLNAVAEE